MERRGSLDPIWTWESGSAEVTTFWTCDFSKEYVTINADYTT
jgi:N-acetylglutamate synthase/N-acetylornithine aminotransferase